MWFILSIHKVSMNSTAHGDGMKSSVPLWFLSGLYRLQVSPLCASRHSIRRGDPRDRAVQRAEGAGGRRQQGEEESFRDAYGWGCRGERNQNTNGADGVLRSCERIVWHDSISWPKVTFFLCRCAENVPPSGTFCAHRIFTQGVKVLKLGFAGTLLIDTASMYCLTGQAGHLAQLNLLWWCLMMSDDDGTPGVLYQYIINALETGRAHSVLESDSVLLPCSCRSWHIYFTCKIIRKDEGECVAKKRHLYIHLDVHHRSVVLDVFISPFQGSTRGKKGVKLWLFPLVECFLGSCSHLDLFPHRLMLFFFIKI